MDAILSADPNMLIFTAVAIIVVGLMFVLKNRTPTALNPKMEYTPFPLESIEVVSHDTRLYKFSLPTPQTKLGLPIGQHISFQFTDSKGKRNQRSYTPITGDEVLGSVTFLVKVYKANVHPKFPDGGVMSQHLDSLRVGDSILMKGPKGHLEYLSDGKFTVQQMRKPLETRKATHFGMIAGGTGLTPMTQVIDAVLRDPKADHIKMSLIYANQTEDDILLRSQLETYMKDYPGRINVHFTLDRPQKDWPYSTGFINKEMIADHLPKVDSENHATQIFMCGPPAMIKFACMPNLKELGFDLQKDCFMF